MLTLLGFNLGWPEILMVAFIVVLLFGATKLPQLFRSFGQGIGEFKKGLKEGTEPEDPKAAAKPPEEKH